MDISNNEPVPNITYINPLIQERRKKHCNCKDRGFVVDENNREVTCNICGSLVDPFEALVEIARKNKTYDDYLDNRRKYAIELEKWFTNNRIPIEIKKLVDEYRNCQSMNVQPKCPHCGKNFKFTDIKSFCNPIFNKANEE